MTVEIPLTQGFIAIIDDCDADLVSFNWRISNGGRYATAAIPTVEGRKDFLLHRVILARMLERSLLRSELVDHVNQDGLCNIRANLRLATQSQNQANRRSTQTNTSGFKGVSWESTKEKWTASIGIRGKTINLGRFTSPIDAAKAYNAKAIELFGEYAYLNPIDEETHD